MPVDEISLTASLPKVLEPFKGKTAVQVTQLLIDDGVKGVRYGATYCPIAQYITKRTHRTVFVNPRHISYDIDAPVVIHEWQGVALGQWESQTLWKAYPEWVGLVEFMTIFDSGRAPRCLYLKAEECMKIEGE